MQVAYKTEIGDNLYEIFMYTYRLKEAILVIVQSNGSRHIEEIAADEVLRVPDDAPENGFIEVVYDGRSVDIFSQDLFRRAERIEIQEK